MTGRLEQFREFREKMNERILERKNLSINRFFTLDTQAYQPGAVDALTKEFAGLSGSKNTNPGVRDDTGVGPLNTLE